MPRGASRVAPVACAALVGFVIGCSARAAQAPRPAPRATAPAVLARPVAVAQVKTPPPAAPDRGETATLSGRNVMLRVDARPRGADQRLRMVWRLIEPSGAERVRETRSFWRDYRTNDDRLRSKFLVVFDSPPDVRETAFLVWSYRTQGTDDDRWVYLPALRKVRRVAGEDRGRSFAGTEFHYDDLSDREVDEETHRFLGSETENGRTLHVVESTPRDPAAPYARRVLRVDAERYTIPRIEYFDRHGRLERELAVAWQEVDGIWDWRRLEMKNVRTGRKTQVEVVEVAHGLGLRDDAFSESALRFGGP